MAKQNKQIVVDTTQYEAVYLNFPQLWREAQLANKQIIFWFDKPNGVTEPYWGQVIGLTLLNDKTQNSDVLLHLKTSDAGDMVFIPLSKALGTRGFEIRAQDPIEEEENK